MSRVAWLIVVTCLLATACGPDGVTESPPLTLAPPSTVAVAGISTSTTTSTFPTTSTAMPSTTTTLPTTTTTEPAPAEPAFLVADEEGIWQVTLHGALTPILTGSPVELAYSDGEGGIIYQEAGGRLDARPILHRRTGEPGAEVLSAGRAADPETGEAVAVRLRGVAEVDGSLTVVYTTITYWCAPPWDQPEGGTVGNLPICDEPIHVLDVESGEDAVVGHLGGWECAAQGPVTMAGGTVIGVTAYYFDDDVQAFEMGNPDSCELLELPSPAPPAGDGWIQTEDPGHFRLVAQDPAGRLLAMTDESWWTRAGVTERVAFLAVLDLRTGEEIRRVDISDRLAEETSIVWLDYDGVQAVVSTGSFDSRTGTHIPDRPIVISPAGEITELARSGLATVAR